MSLKQYLELATWSAAQVRQAPGAAPPEALAEILRQQGIVPENWLSTLASFQRLFGNAVGSQQALQQVLDRRSGRHFHGQRACRSAFLSRAGPAPASS